MCIHSLCDIVSHAVTHYEFDANLIRSGIIHERCERVPAIMSRPLIVAHTGTGGERGRIMSPDGISVALSATDYKDPPKVLVEEKVNGRQNNRSRLTEPGKRSPGQGPSFIGGGICQAIRATDYKDPPKVLVESTPHTIKHCTK